MAQDAVKKLDYFELIQDDKLFGKSGKIIDSDVYEILPEVSKKKFQQTNPDRKRKSPSGGLASQLESLYNGSLAPAPSPWEFEEPMAISLTDMDDDLYVHSESDDEDEDDDDF